MLFFFDRGRGRKQNTETPPESFIFPFFFFFTPFFFVKKKEKEKKFVRVTHTPARLNVAHHKRARAFTTIGNNNNNK